MTTDGILLYCLTNELNHTLKNGRIDKIHGLDKGQILIKVRSAQSSHQLLLSIHPVDGGLYISHQDFHAPSQPSLFTMVLRKHLSGAKIINIETFQMDRILFIHFATRNDIGDLSRKTIILEVMGKHSNMILVDESFIIIDAMKKYNHLISRHREVLPNLPYVFPPSSSKHNLLEYTMQNLIPDLVAQTAINGDWTIEKLLSAMFQGLSIHTSKTLLQYCAIPSLTLPEFSKMELTVLENCLASFKKTLQNPPFCAYIQYQEDIPHQVSLFPMDNTQICSGFSEALDAVYTTKNLLQSIQHEKQILRKNVSLRIKKLEKKLKIHQQNICLAKETDMERIKGELLTANLYQIRNGMKEIVVDNYYDPDFGKITIPLDPSLSPSANVSRYFKRVSKIREAAKISREMLYTLEKEIAYLDSVLLSVDEADSPIELLEIRDEILGDSTYQVHKKNKKSANPISLPLHFVSSTGLDIYVGKNNKQNDALTKSAEGHDLWLHTKQIPGSHVILKTNQGNYDDQSLLEAALLAAAHSKGRDSSKVPVDYTFKKNLRKPNKAKAGMVTYESNQTILVDPSKQALAKIMNTTKKATDK